MVLFGCSLQSQSQIRVYQQPPTLKQTPPPGAKSALLMSPASGTASTCNPEANVSTDGNIVHVNLDIVLANFTMFNPSSGVDDSVVLRSYGGCAAGQRLRWTLARCFAWT
jgi:hypothetical protein